MMTPAQRSALWSTCPVPNDYYSGQRTPYACPVDNLLGFTRCTGKELTQYQDEEHVHHRWLWIYANSGRAVNVVRVRTLPLSPGEMLLIPGYSPHYHQAVPDMALEWYFLSFECENPLWRSRLGERVFHPSEDEQALFDEASSLLLTGQVTEAALTLSLFHESLMKHLPESTAEDRWLLRIQDWASRVEGEATIRELAKELGGSESHLRAQFREKTGVSLGAYLLHLRMVRAVECLHDSQLSITEVAYRLGYGTPGNFSRAFRREMGVSPRAFRDQLHGEQRT